MPKKKIQITLTDVTENALNELSEKRGYAKSIIIAMAIEMMCKAEKAQKGGCNNNDIQK